MSLSSLCRPLALAPLIWALSLAPVTAQEARAKDGWDMLRNSLSEAGFIVGSAGISNTQNGLEVHAVTIRPARGGAAVLSLPTLGVEPRGGDGFAFIPGGDSRLELPSSGEIRLRTEGEIVFNRDADSLRLAPALDMVEATFFARAGALDADRVTLRLGLDALYGALEMGLGPEVDLTGELHAEALLFAQSWLQGPAGQMGVSRRETAEVDDVTVRLRMDGLEVFSDSPAQLAEIFERGFSLQMDYVAAGSRSSSHQDIAGQIIRFDSTTGPSDSVLAMADGVLSVRGNAADFRLHGAFAGIEGGFSADRMAAGFEMPLVPSAAPGRFGLMMEIEGMQVSEESLAMLGAQAFAGETADAEIEVVAEGRWMVDLAEAETADDLPLDIAAVRLDRFALRLGQATLEGSGRFEPTPGVQTPADAFPMGEGTFTFNLQGGEALLDRLGREGILPPDQQFLARMILGALGRRVGDDQLQSEVSILPGGQIRVNGLPLPF